jgi:predicted dehydrogenase
VRVGFIGTGLIATFHSKMLRAAGDLIERAGCFDVDPTRSAAFAAASGHRAVDSEEEVLDGCDAVYVCTWTAEHRRVVEAAAARGLAVFCEKPLATNLADAVQMAEAVRAAGVVNQVGLILRRSPAYVTALDLVRDPSAGRLMAVVVRDDQFIPTQGHYGSTWRSSRDLAGAGTLLEHSIHDVDMLRMFAGDVAVVNAHQSNFHGHDGIEDAVGAVLRCTGGVTATLASVWHDNLARPSLRRFELICERRLVELDGDDWFGPVRWTDGDGSTGSLEGEALAERATAHLDGDANPDVAFVRAAIEGSAAWPSFDTAVAAHRVVDAMYRSAGAGGATVEVGG